MDISASFAVTLTTIKQPVAGALYPTNFSHLLCQFLYRQIHHLKWNAIDFPCVQTPVSIISYVAASTCKTPLFQRKALWRIEDARKITCKANTLQVRSAVHDTQYFPALYKHSPYTYATAKCIMRAHPNTLTGARGEEGCFEHQLAGSREARCYVLALDPSADRDIAAAVPCSWCARN